MSTEPLERASPQSRSPRPEEEGACSPAHQRRDNTDEENNSTDSDPAEDRASSGGHNGESVAPPPATKPDWGSQEPLDLGQPRNGVEGPPPFPLAKKKSPVDVLARVFPKENRSLLGVVLQRNGGDVLQAIDDLLSSKAAGESGAPHPLGPLPPTREGRLAEPAHQAAPPSFGTSATGPSFASVLSSISGGPPLSSSGSALAMAGGPPFRRPFASGPRGLLAVPTYPGFFPGLSPGFAPGYPNFFGSALPPPHTQLPVSTEERKKGCWSPCGEAPSPQDLSSPEAERKSPNGFAD